MTLTIGELAAAAGVNIQTVRYYERRGLLPEPPRTPSGYRQYPPDTPHRLRFIKRAQELGFSLAEVGELLELRVEESPASPAACATVEACARQKLRQVGARIRELRRLELTLKRLARACAERTHTGTCPILESIEEASHPAGDVIPVTARGGPPV